MDALELLNVLDIIKNQEVYEQRYQALKDAQFKLEYLQEIAQTVEAAQLLRSDAEKYRAQYIKQLEDAKKDIEVLRQTKLQDLDKREELLNLHEGKLNAREQALKEQFVVLRIGQDQIKTDREILVKQTSAVQQNLQEATDIKTLYTTKLNELKRIVANG